MKAPVIRSGVSAILAVATFCSVLTGQQVFDNQNASIAFPLLSPGFVLAQVSSEPIARTVFKKASPAVVTIRAAIEQGWSQGSGFIVRPDGLIVTNAHVLEGSNPRNITVEMHDGRKLSAELVGFDSTGRDLAALRVYNQRNLPTLALAKGTVSEGDPVVAIGSPYNLPGTLTAGVVSRIDSKRSRIQTSAAVNHGNSGGPLLNANAEVIGVNTSIRPSDDGGGNIGIAFAVPTDQVRLFLTNIQQGRISRESQRPAISGTLPKPQKITLNGASIKGSINTNSGKLAGGEFFNPYLFEGKQGQRIRIEMISQEIYPQLILQRSVVIKTSDGKEQPAWQIIAQNDGATPGDGSARIDTILQSDGTYAVLASTLTERAGEYRLRASADARTAQTLQAFCGATNDIVSEQNIPTTLVWVPDRKGFVALIRWQSEIFSESGWTPQKRCEEVSKRFQQNFDAGNFYLTLFPEGKPKGMCLVQEPGQTCEERNFLFTFNPNVRDQPEKLREQLVNIFGGQTSIPLFQGGGSNYVSLQEYFKSAPLFVQR